MRKIKLKLALKAVNFGIWLYEANADMPWNSEDRFNVKKLWELHDKYSLELNGLKRV